MANVQNRLGDHAETIAEQSRQYVREHAISTAAIAFGMGLATGLAVISLLADSGPSRKAAVSERLGTQLLEAMREHIPSSWTGR